MPAGRAGGDPLWTVEEACAWFADGGVPVDPAALELIIRGLRRLTGGARWAPAGRAGSGGQGGVGKARYPVRDLMILHADLAKWLPGGPGAGCER